ncbi:MAG: 3-dehydroquinate synthase [Armatimonadota bacterium]|nr:3-dehydroquinate synthase [Armatimonadota bacterium]
MQPLQQDIQVNFHYTVHFTTDLFAPGNTLLAEVIRDGSATVPQKMLVVVDRGLHEHQPSLLNSIEEYCRQHQDALNLVRPPLLIPGGESVKNNPQHVAQLHEVISETGLDRHSFVVVVGGGGVLDLVGFAAATAHRGIRLIRVPSTVLAQNDSGVGVKNGINCFGKKNFLGTFAPPYAVLNDFQFLATLPDRDWRSGIAEAIKVALIKDAAFFDFLEHQASALVNRDMTAMQQLVYHCAALHLRHIATSGDPFEFGSSRPLDFGHWAAHKLEQLTDYHLRHGEAVAIGIALDTTYSHLAGFLSAPDWQRVINLLHTLGFTLHVPELSQYLDQPEHPRCIFRGLNEFREHLGGQLTIMLLRRIGQGFEVHDIDEPLMAKSIQVLQDDNSTRH